MRDWDNNGKIDHKDSTLFHVETEKDYIINKTNITHNEEDGEKYAIWIANTLSVLWLFIVFNFGIPVNSFTAILTLISICCLGWSLFVLFINFTSR